MEKPKGLRGADEVVPRLGAKSGAPALRIGPVAAYDRPLEHMAGDLDTAEIRLPLRFPDARYGVILAFALAKIDLSSLARELVRIAHPLGRIWVVVWKKDRLPDGAPSWDDVHATFLATDWVDNKILSFGDDLYGTQFVLRKARR